MLPQAKNKSRDERERPSQAKRAAVPYTSSPRSMAPRESFLTKRAGVRLVSIVWVPGALRMNGGCPLGGVADRHENEEGGSRQPERYRGTFMGTFRTRWFLSL